MFIFPITTKKVQKWASKDKIDLLIKVLGDPKCKTDVKITAIDLLGKKHVTKAIPVLAGMIHELSFRKSLISCFGNLKDPTVYDILINLLRNDKENEAEIVYALEKINYPDAIPILLEKVTSGSNRDIIIQAIKVIADKNKSYNVILKSFTSNQSEDYLISLCKILAGNANEEIQSKLNEYIFTENAQLRKEIGLAKKTKKQYQWDKWLIGDADDFYRLVNSDEDYIYDLLMEQYEKGNKILDQYAEAFVSRIFRIDDATIQEKAFCFIEKHKMVHAIPEFVKHLCDFKGPTRLRMVKALSVLGNHEYEELIEGDSMDFIRLFEHNPQEVGPLLTYMLTHTFSRTTEELQTLSEVISYLAKSGKPEAIEVLVSGIGETKTGNQCFDAIPPNDSENFDAVISEMLTSFDRKLRIKAAKKLDELGDHRWIDIVKGDENDAERLCLAGCKAAINNEIVNLGLDKRLREKSAHILLKVLKNNPQDVLNWSDVQKKLTVPHKDTHEDNHGDTARTTDCHSDNGGSSIHDDLGFSLSFTDEQLRFFKEVEYEDRQKNNAISEEYLIELFELKQSSLKEQMFIDARRYSSKKMIEVMGQLMEKESSYSKKAFEYLLLHKEEALPFFVKSLLSYRDEDIFREIISSGERAYALLIELLSESKEINNVIEVLGLIGNKNAIGHIVSFINAPDKGIRKSAAAALINLGESDWKDIIYGDDDDIERLVKKCDIRLLNWYKNSFTDPQFTSIKVLLAKTLAMLGEKELAGDVRELLISSNHRVTDVAQALSLIDDTDWSKVIMGQESDFARIAEVGNEEALKVLLVFLKADARKTRAAAAESLIAMAKTNFTVVQHHWNSISAAIAQKHEDSIKHLSHWAETRSGDCHSDFDVHTDTGLGLIIPENIDLKPNGK